MGEKIFITDEIKKDMMNRIIIIHRDGSMDVVSSPKDMASYYHIKYFQKYLSEKYLDDETIQRYAAKASEPSTLIFLFLKSKGDFVFTETTKDLEEQQYGIVYLPDTVSSEQVEKIEQLKREHLDKFDELLVYAEFYLNEFSMIDNRVYEHITPPNYKLLDDHFCIEENKHL